MSKDEYLGLIDLTLLLVPKFVSEETEKKDLFSPSKLSSSASTPVLIRNKRAPYQLWQCVVNVILVECNNLLAMDSNGFSDPYVKFRLENERYRSKTIRRTLNPRFLEQFQLYIYDTNKMVMNISVYDYDPTSNSDDFIGKTAIDLKNLDIEKTHLVKSELENDAGSVTLLVTITGIYDTAIFPENIGYNRIFSPEYREEIENKYGLLNSLSNLDDVGWLRVKVLRAENLASADMNGKSDPFCCLQLDNKYVQTYTVYKTLNPEWGQIFEFEVNDIHSILEVTVLDEDKNKVYEFLGKIEIPLINIQNGKKKIYALKDKKLQKKSKGGIELQMELVYNPIKAVIKTFNPTDERLITQEPKLKVPVLKQNIKRVHNLVQGMINTGNFINSCFCWEYPVRSIIAFLSFVLIVLNFEIYMLPLTLLMIFLKNLMIIKFKTFNTNQDDEELNFECFDEEEDVSDPDSIKEPKKSFRERLNEIQEICLKVQTTLDYVASLGEKIYIFVQKFLAFLVGNYNFVYYDYDIVFGANKIHNIDMGRPPGFVDSMEILDFLSRVPSKKELYKYREEILQNNTEAVPMKSNNKKKRKTS
ncbi:multiple C2 and transmembrane domain-containing 1-like isoform X4 [Brachionus plicatilis]|uniref:Multiple C2 and transmembrane domain-containing 1-like isoform X4 n=1 Tax=Brachionus plicatilis TaxID=10195 RepID=A0A3M7P404_BRAPC|nr:multiple C2 and transmembrane domain-containing 1-like isoform X4 [Brachionus plicatilis]